MTTQTLNGIQFVVAKPETKEPPFRYLTGKDYPKLCAKCQAAIDQAAALFAMPELSELLADGRWSQEDDPERPCNYVYDHAQFCGGHTCLEKEKNERLANQLPVDLILSTPLSGGNWSLGKSNDDDWLKDLRAKATERWGKENEGWVMRVDRHWLYPQYAVQLVHGEPIGEDLVAM